MVKVNEQGKNKVEIIVNIKGKEWISALDKAFEKVSKDAKVDGFRKGKVPKEIFEKKFGKEKIWMEATDILVPRAYEMALEKSKLSPATQPTVNIGKISDEEIEYIFIIVTKPVVELGTYKDLKIKKEIVNVTKEEIEHELGHMRERYAEVIIKEEPIEEGDIAIIDFEGFKDGKPFDGGKSENHSLEIGSHSFIPGFEEALIGLKVKEEKDIKLKFPDDYQSEELKGQDVIFKVKINEIKTKKIPDLDQDFFDDLGLEGIEDEKSLKKMIKDNIKARKDMENENAFVDQVLEKASETMKVEIPEEIISEELDRMIEKYAETLKMQGIDIEAYYKMTNSKEEDLRKHMEEEANKRVKYRLLLEGIVKEENIKITKKELDLEVDKIAKDYQMTKEQILEAFGNMDVVEYDLKMRKAIEFLKENNRVS